MKAEERRQKLLTLLEGQRLPLSASQLASQLGVSRQVIVGDIALLRARHLDILSTHKGYVMANHMSASQGYRQKIVCQHDASQLREELETIVSLGGSLLDVEIDHPIYGLLKAPLSITSQEDIDSFLSQLETYQGQLLCELTSGIHTHTIACPSQKDFETIQSVLQQKKILWGK